MHELRPLIIAHLVEAEWTDSRDLGRWAVPGRKIERLGHGAADLFLNGGDSGRRWPAEWNVPGRHGAVWLAGQDVAGPEGGLEGGAGGSAGASGPADHRSGGSGRDAPKAEAVTPEIGAGAVPRPERPWRILAWLRGLMRRREPDAWVKASDARLARLEAEMEQRPP